MVHGYRAIYHPDSLVEITGNALNNLPEPVCWSWSVSNVVDWVRYGLKLPQYIVSIQFILTFEI